MTWQGSALALIGAVFLLDGLALAIFRSAVSKQHRRWMEMFRRRLSLTGIRPKRSLEEATSPGAWLTIGILAALMGAGFLFAGLNLLLRH